MSASCPRALQGVSRRADACTVSSPTSPIPTLAVVPTPPPTTNPCIHALQDAGGKPFEQGWLVAKGGKDHPGQAGFSKGAALKGVLSQVRWLWAPQPAL